MRVSDPEEPYQKCKKSERNRDRPVDPEPFVNNICRAGGIPLEHRYGKNGLDTVSESTGNV